MSRVINLIEDGFRVLRTFSAASVSDPLHFQRMLRHEGQRFVELEYALVASQGPSARSTHGAGKAEGLFQGPAFQHPGNEAGGKGISCARLVNGFDLVGSRPDHFSFPASHGATLA